MVFVGGGGKIAIATALPPSFSVLYYKHQLLISMSAIQAEDVRACFLFVVDFNGHHQEWLGSSTTNCHGVAAFDFASVSGYNQLVVGPTHVLLDNRPR